VVWREHAESLHLAIGANAAKTAWLNGALVAAADVGYLWLAPVELRAGANLIEIRLVAEEDLLISEVLVGGGHLRAFWALVRDPATFRKPEWMLPPAVAEGGSADTTAFATSFVLDEQVSTATLRVVAESQCTVLVDDVELGKQGGFPPSHVRTVRDYSLSDLAPGCHTIRCDVAGAAGDAALLVDSLLPGVSAGAADGVSGLAWVIEGTVPSPVRLRRRPWLDPSFTDLRGRPHPLPDASWLEPREGQDTVVSLQPDGFAAERAVTWLRWTLPPGARACSLPVGGADAQLWVDGEQIPVSEGGASLPRAEAVGRSAVLRVAEAPGRTAGAVLAGPVTYETGPGQMHLGDWAEQGLAACSGGVRYRTQLNLAARDSQPMVLDLGRVVGTAQVWVNGVDVGTRVMSPYCFALPDGLVEGANRIEVLVLNTLGPFVDAVSPTPFVFPIQRSSGLFGPVRVRTDPEPRKVGGLGVHGPMKESR